MTFQRFKASLALVASYFCRPDVATETPTVQTNEEAIQIFLARLDFTDSILAKDGEQLFRAILEERDQARSDLVQLNCCEIRSE